eukprot:XP_001709663.1 Hypothetical protein GL50803_34489 [Giardia lamblia ATCC 50803]
MKERPMLCGDDPVNILDCRALDHSCAQPAEPVSSHMHRLD